MLIGYRQLQLLRPSLLCSKTELPWYDFLPHGLISNSSDRRESHRKDAEARALNAIRFRDLVYFLQ